MTKLTLLGFSRGDSRRFGAPAPTGQRGVDCSRRRAGNPAHSTAGIGLPSSGDVVDVWRECDSKALADCCRFHPRLMPTSTSTTRITGFGLMTTPGNAPCPRSSPWAFVPSSTRFAFPSAFGLCRWNCRFFFIRFLFTSSQPFPPRQSADRPSPAFDEHAAAAV